MILQIVYNDKERRSCFTLIVVTVNEHQRTEWVDKLRTGSSTYSHPICLISLIYISVYIYIYDIYFM